MKRPSTPRLTDLSSFFPPPCSHHYACLPQSPASTLQQSFFPNPASIQVSIAFFPARTHRCLSLASTLSASVCLRIVCMHALRGRALPRLFGVATACLAPFRSRLCVCASALCVLCVLRLLSLLATASSGCRVLCACLLLPIAFSLGGCNRWCTQAPTQPPVSADSFMSDAPAYFQPNHQP